jgi:transcriptional regulator with XRE-family HTH domain
MANSHALEEFSRRLRKAFQDKGISTDSPTSLAGQFSKNYPALRVSQQAVRKWLNAENMPSHAKIMALAEWLGVPPNWLEYGVAEGAGHSMNQPDALQKNTLPDQELLRHYRKLHPRQQQAVAEIITALAAKDRRR